MAMALEAELGATLVDRAARGDGVAFARLVAAYHRDLVRVAYVICGDATLAQDAAQAAWTVAWRKLGSLRDSGRVKSWLVAVAANEARQLVRRQHRRAIAELKVPGLGVSGDGGSIGDPGDQIDRVDLVNALSRLRPADRTLLALRYVAGLDSTELGERLGMSASGTRARLARLLARLRGELEHG